MTNNITNINQKKDDTFIIRNMTKNISILHWNSLTYFEF